MASFSRLRPDPPPDRRPCPQGCPRRRGSRQRRDVRSAKWALGGIIGGGAAAGLLAAGSSALALYFARRVITPARFRGTRTRKCWPSSGTGTGAAGHSCRHAGHHGGRVYGFFFDGGNGHARIGRILSYSPAERTVLREVEAVYGGDLATARRGWWSGAAYPDPAAARACRRRTC